MSQLAAGSGDLASRLAAVWEGKFGQLLEPEMPNDASMLLLRDIRAQFVAALGERPDEPIALLLSKQGDQKLRDLAEKIVDLNDIVRAQEAQPLEGE
jgi:hypothetical protein